MPKRIPITTDAKTGHAADEEKEITDIVDRIFSRVTDDQIARDEIEQKKQVVAILVEPAQVEAMLSVLALVDIENSDPEYLELIAPINARLLFRYTPEKFKIESMSPSEVDPSLNRIRVVKNTRNEGDENQ